MKRVWVKAVPWDREIALAAMECGADALWAPPGWVSEVRKMGIIPIVAEDGDLKPGQDVIEKEVRDKRDEEEIVTLSISKTVVVKGVDRTIMPLENLLSKMDHLFVEIENLHEGRTAFGILEKGVEGVVINNPDPDAVRHILLMLKEGTEKIELFTARVKRILPLGLGDRVCVDTCSSMVSGEGMLVGNSSQTLFLIPAENMENPFVNTRPFRVNAGPVHAYIRMADGQTKYLSEIGTGDRVLVVNFEGKSYPAVVERTRSRGVPWFW